MLKEIPEHERRFTKIWFPICCFVVVLIYLPVNATWGSVSALVWTSLFGYLFLTVVGFIYDFYCSKHESAADRSRDVEDM